MNLGLSIFLGGLLWLVVTIYMINDNNNRPRSP